MSEEQSSSDHTLALQCHLHCWIGAIDVEVEEHSSGETNLKKALELSGNVSSVDLVIFAKIKALIQVIVNSFKSQTLRLFLIFATQMALRGFSMIPLFYSLSEQVT